MLDNVTVLEGTFFLMSLLGAILSVWGVATNAKDAKLMLVKRSGYPLPLIVSTLNRLYQVSFRMAIHAAMLVVAGMAIMLPPPPPQYSEIPQVLASMIGWVVAACFLVIKELLDRRERRELERYYDDQHPHRRATDIMPGGM